MSQEAKTKTGKDSKPASRKQSLKEKEEEEKTEQKAASRKASLKDKTDEEKPESKPGSRKPSLSEEKAKKAEVKIHFKELQQMYNNVKAVTKEALFNNVKWLKTVIELIFIISCLIEGSTKREILEYNNMDLGVPLAYVIFFPSRCETRCETCTDFYLY